MLLRARIERHMCGLVEGVRAGDQGGSSIELISDRWGRRLAHQGEAGMAWVCVGWGGGEFLAYSVMEEGVMDGSYK